ncbi:MAG TPA: YbaB/EbfC family nucleoid-associated protein [Halanaerobiales bacterium]|nr:YbaB/EbfC family nucleoid-associated protein [Halanaerobiales bacterium]
MNMNKLMKQAQKMQAKMSEMQEELENKTYEATSGGGAVKALVNGKKEVLDLQIDEDVVDPEDVEMLEDLILAAINKAMSEATEELNEKMGQMTGGMNLPGMF